MRVLVLNSGSSSLKFRVVESACLPRSDTAPPDLMTILGGSITRIGHDAAIQWHAGGPATPAPHVRNHHDAVRCLFDQVDLHGVDAVGHRVVHGGSRFVEPVRLDDVLIAELEALTVLAPLHTPPSLMAIHAARAVLGGTIPMVAVFDTAFHAEMPANAATYAVPHDLGRRHGIRRYGFHGLAHTSLAAGYAAATRRSVKGTRLITLQLGNGCSATAIRDGRSVDTSMGMTPLEGLVMGTRSGDVDPAIVAYLAQREAVDADTVLRWLNERSGLLGLSGLSSDVREILAAERSGNEQAALAVDVFCYRARQYVGAYLAALGGANAVVFGGGIGEHAAPIRERICAGMEWCGLRLDAGLNNKTVALEAGTAACISPPDAALPAYVVAVDEEAVIAGETLRCLAGC
jgi:acetate kinase